MLFNDDAKKNAFLLYCYFQFLLGLFIVALTFRHPESEVYLIPSIIINLCVPAILMYISRFRFKEAVMALIGISFVCTTAYVVTTAIDNQNALAAMLFITYFIHACVLSIVFGQKVGLIYFFVGFLCVLLKQLNVFKAYEFEFIYSYSKMEYMLFLTLYLGTLMKFLHIAQNSKQ
ncbi:hypothetical protein [Fulvivirga lutea]|uniref:Uncharacterized protein n=1 Tax=Fulvivirga lutea TaxID=2810512 RepID=A0A975A0Z1_9BACT|nr:hypothetical protein [Fulvivirga lutea]QSE97316.1 hypothetical protein JR347_17295 [Fulvivirga lutea]